VKGTGESERDEGRGKEARGEGEWVGKKII